MEMLTNLRIHADNEITDAGAMTVSSESASYPASNVRHEFRTRSWRTTGGEFEWIAFDTGVNQAYAEAICMINHNLIAGTFKIQAGNNSDWSELILDEEFDSQESVFVYDIDLYGDHGYGGYMSEDEQSEFAPDFTRIYYFQTGGVNARYWRLVMSEPSESGLSHMELGRLMIGKYISPNYNIKYGVKVYPVDESQESYSDGGQRYVDRKPKRRAIEFEFNSMDDSEAFWTFFSWLYRQGKRQNYMIVPSPSDDDLTKKFFMSIYGHMKGDPPGISMSSFGLNDISSSVTFWESL